MDNFTYCLPTRFVFGRGAEKQVGAELEKLGAKRVLIHYGGGSAVRSGLIGRVEADLRAHDMEVVELGGVLPNPRDDMVYAGIELVRRENIDFILAIGGGSAIDSAKAIALGAKYDGDFWDFYSDRAVPKARLPLGVILTLSATGSESSDSSVITRKATLEKRGLSTELNRPVISFMNPELPMTAPVYQIACGATDILAHVMERYFTTTTDVDLTDRLLEATMQAVIRAGRIAVRDPHDYEAQAQLMWGGTIAHNNSIGIGRVSDFGSHKIEHEMSAIYDVAHGAGLAVVFPAWMRFHIKKHPGRIAQFANRVYNVPVNFENLEETALRGVEAHEAFLREIGMPVTLAELGVKREDIPRIAAGAKRIKGTDLVGGAWPVNGAEIEEILRIADR